MLWSAKQNYFNSLTSANSKQFWKTVKLVNKQQETIPVLSQDNTNAITDEEKSNMLNSYFSKCWNHSEPPLTDPLECNYEETCPDHLFCTTQEIVQLIKGLDVSKANGPDGISARMLKATSESIAPSLTNLFNLSIAKDHFPKLWKATRVVPIHKSINSTEVQNPWCKLVNMFMLVICVWFCSCLCQVSSRLSYSLCGLCL